MGHPHTHGKQGARSERSVAGNECYPHGLMRVTFRLCQAKSNMGKASNGLLPLLLAVKWASQ
jgi:hypothetical protein